MLTSLMAIETGGMFDRLVENGFLDEGVQVWINSLEGTASSLCTKNNEAHEQKEWDLPVIVFLDGDPWSFRSLASIA